MKGRNSPKVYETSMTLLCWARNSRITAQPRGGVRSSNISLTTEGAENTEIHFDSLSVLSVFSVVSPYSCRKDLMMA